MISRIRRAMLAAVVGALAAGLSLIAAYVLHPGLVFEMDRPLPSFIQGMSGLEQDAQGTFAWTGPRVTVDIPGLDRQIGWSCTVRFRGPRPPGLPMPVLDVQVDGTAVSHTPATAEYQDLGVILPAASRSGASIVLAIAPTFVPGGTDNRELGVQLDRLLCRPSSSIVRPPSNTLSEATLAAAIFAFGLALLGLSLSSAMFAAAAIGLGQTLMMALGSGMYGAYPGKLPWLAFGVVVPVFVLAQLIERWRREPLTSSARFVMAATASVLFLKLAGLYHPSKPILDAMFNMHKLDAVLAGQFHHLQNLGNGVLMPYGIGLYIFAAPWAWLFTDHMAVIWTVAAGMDVLAGALLYPVLLRAWGDRRAAALAAVFFQLVPLPFVALGDANLANLFGQSMALVAILSAVTWSLALTRPATLAVFAILTAWAFCSHVSTVTMLSAVLGVLALLYLWRGDSARRRSAVAIIVAVAVAAAFAWFAFYQQFLGEFRAAFSVMFHPPTPEHASVAALAKGDMTIVERIRDLARQAVNGLSWPLLLLSAIGVWSLVRRRVRDRLESALIAWAVMWVALSASTVFSGVDAAHVRYAVGEFFGRINLATVPLVAILAARGAASGWEPTMPDGVRRPLKYLAAGLCVWTVLVAMQAWIGWFRR